MDVDLIAEAREGRQVLIAKMSTEPQGSGSGPVMAFFNVLESSPDSIEFGMFVDPNAIRLYRRGSPPPYPAATLDSTEILSHYLPLRSDRLTENHRDFGTAEARAALSSAGAVLFTTTDMSFE